MVKNTNVLLIGMPGSGKSFIGQSLSNRHSVMFYDLDKFIEKKHDSINNIFNNFGENYFRNLEYNEFVEIKNYKINKIISVGGGFVETIDKKNIDLTDFFVIYIKNSKENIMKNLYFDMDKNIRPIFLNDKTNNYFNLSEKIDNLFLKRESLYIKYSNIFFNSNQEISILDSLF